MIEQKLKSKLPLVDITIDINEMSDKEKQEYVGTLGTHPIIYFNGLHIDENDIRFLTINSFNFAPTIEMTFTDSTGLLDDKSYPLDNSIISLYVDSKSQVYKEIRMDFKILNYTINKSMGKKSSLSLNGSINCDYLFLQDNIALSNMTSYQAMEQISRDSGLGLASNFDSTNDSMTWINPYLTGAEFIQSISQRSFIKDESFLWSYIDLYNNLNFIDIETVLELEIKKDDTNPKTFYSDKRETEASSLVLTNDEVAKDSNNYFKATKIINRSTQMSIDSGYRRRVHMYDTSGNWGSKAGEFLIFDLDSINSPGAEEKSIVLKSGPTGEEFYKKNINHEYLGKLDKDNVHIDYLYATSQNGHNISNLQKIAVEITMPNPNYSLTRYQKINVAFSNQSTNITGGHINARLSGEWVIIGLGYKYSKMNGGRLEQIITLVRRELSPDLKE